MGFSRGSRIFRAFLVSFLFFALLEDLLGICFFFGGGLLEQG